MKFAEIIDYCAQDNRNVFHNLLSRCKSGYAVPYIGAGLSMFTGLPSWTGFLDMLRGQCPDKNFSLDNPLMAADVIEEQLGSTRFYEYFQKEFHHDMSDDWWRELLINYNVSNQAVSIIPRLFHGPVITSNYDKIIEAVHDFKIEVAKPEEIKKLEYTNDEVKHLLYKVHGCISQPEKVIFTGKSYEIYYSSNSSHVKILSKFFKRFNLLFLGCSLNMLNMDKPIELWETLVNSGQQHYALLPCAERDFENRRKELESINIYPIFYPVGKHECVRIILEELLIEKESDSIKVPVYNQEKFPFVGRSEILDEIKTNLNNQNNSVLFLSGIGGVGKTRIACEYARLNKKEYPSGIYFFHAVSEEIIFADIIQFARINNLEIDLDQGQSVVYDKFAEWMNNNDNWLFILDNMEEYNHIKKLTEFVQDKPIKGKKDFIITTRNTEKRRNCIVVDIFSEEETKQFLFKFTKKKPNEYSKKIAELLGRLPLALEQAASYIVKEKINYKKYYQLLDKKGLLETLKKGECTDNTLAVNATFNLSIEKLSNEETKQVLYMCSYFASENIKIGWLRESHTNLQLYPELCKKLKSVDKSKKMVGELASYSLIREDNGKINIHRLTQTVVRKVLKDDVWLEVCSKTMAKVFDLGEFDKANSKSMFLETVPHMEQMFSFYGNGRQKPYTAALGQLYHLYMFGFDKIKEHDIALTYLDRTLLIRKKFDDKRSLAKTLNLAGVVYQNKGAYEQAASFFDKALELRKEVFKVSRDNMDGSFLAKTYNNIALNYYWMGELEQSKNFHLLAIDIKEKCSDINDQAFSYNNIGALFEAMSKRDNYLAMSYHQKAYNIRKNMGSMVNLAFTLNNIGVIEKNSGNYKDALIYLNKALDLREAVHGSDAVHPDIAQTCTNIADIYINMGRLKKAKQVLDRAINIYEVKLTDKHIDTSKAYYNLAKWYYVQSLYDDASSWFQKVLDIRQTTQSKESYGDIKELERMIINCKKQAKGEKLL